MSAYTELIEMLESVGGRIDYEDGTIDAIFVSHCRATDEDFGLFLRAELPGLKYLDLSHTLITDRGLSCLSRQTQLEVLRVGHTAITGTGFRELDFRSLRTLYLRGCAKFGSEGAVYLPRFKSVEELWLNGSGVDDSCLAHVGKLYHLKTLWLDETGITDAGLSMLCELTELRGITTGKTAVTKDGLSRLRQKLPGLNLGLVL